MPKRKRINRKKRRGSSRNKNIPKKREIIRSGKKYFFGKISKVFLAGTATLITLYSAVGFVAGTEVLKEDLQNKYGKVLGTVNVSVLIRGMPVKPVVIATPGCSESYPYIDLDWADDLGADTFDVYRDNELLVTGITASGYRDGNVELATSYIYYVVVNGPAGTEQSDEISAVAETECYTPPPPPPPVEILSLIIGGIDVTNFQCCPKINKTKPVFSGTTNIPKARVAVGIQSGRRSIISNFPVNKNGYWSWKSRTKLSRGLKTFYLTIADPDDASRVASTSFQFRIGKSKMKKKTLKKCAGGTVLEDIIDDVHPFFISHLFHLTARSQNGIIHSGEVLGFFLSRFQEDSSQSGVAFHELEIMDHRGNLVYRESRKLNEQDKDGNLSIGEKIAPGKYKLIAKYFEGDLEISAEDDFEIKEKPILVLGSGYAVTYRQMVSNLGWVALFSLGLTGIFLFLLLFEYHLSKRALFQVTESDLKGKGMID